MKLKLPKSLLELPEKDRDDIIDVLKESLRQPETITLPRYTGDEHNMWERNHDPLMADAEDQLYQELVDPWTETMADVFLALGLTTDGVDISKAITPEFEEWEGFVKSKDSGRRRMSDLIQANKKKQEQFIKLLQDGTAFTKAQLKKLDNLLSSKLPNYAQKAEDFMVRAGFIGKIRNQAERENLEVLGALIDRYPETIEAASKEGVVLTLREKMKAEAQGKKVSVLPLTKQERNAVTHASHHAGDKMTEISTKQMAGVRQMVMRAQKERWSASKLAQALFDMYGDQNRDWRRVAITELAFATNDAYLSGVEEGSTVIGMGADNACKHCKQYVIGKEFTVTHTPPSEDSYESDMKMVWAGKSNYGRRVAEYVAAIPMHPNCRCRWHRISRFYKVDNHGTLKRKTTAELIQEERAKRGLAPDPNIEAELERIRSQIEE